MPTLIYAPGVRVYIESEKNGTIDVSDDLTSGTLVRRCDGVSTFSFTLANARRKYDHVFTPNDRIVVLMKRLTWVRVFTGLLNSVPIKTAWPREVPLEASCSLKRLQYWYWDPLTAETQTMIASALESAQAQGTDGGITNVILTILQNVVDWPSAKVHIGQIPLDWYQIAASIAKRLETWAEESDTLSQQFLATLGASAVIGGVAMTPEAAAAAAGTLDPTALGAAGTADTSSFSWGDLGVDQRQNAATIYSVGVNMGMSSRDIVIAIATARQESGLSNIGYGDAAGPDSRGLFQQRASWGPLATRMDPAGAARLFFNALKQVPNRPKKPEWECAYEVQRCAAQYKTRYQQWVPLARQIVNDLNAVQAQGASGRQLAQGLAGAGAGVSGSMTGQSFLSAALRLVTNFPHIPYTERYGGTQLKVIGANPPPGLDCSSFVQAVMLRAAGSLKGCPRVASAQAAWCQRISAHDALNTPGALVFLSNNGSVGGVYHVEVSLGDGRRTVGAHHSGTVAGIGNDGPGYWSFGGLLPGVAYPNVGAGGPTTTVGTTGPKSTLSGGGGHWPVSPHKVTTAYKKPGSWAAGYHTGVDFAANIGDPVTSASAGKVIGAGSYGEYGNAVRVRSGNTFVLYGHLSSISVKVGDKLSPGDPIGKAGDTGRAFGPHLHFEVRTAPFNYGDDADPLKFITDGIWASSAGIAGAAGTDGGAVSADSTTATGTQPPLIQPVDASTLPGYNPKDPIDKMFGNSPWVPLLTQTTQESMLANALTGVRALLNDQPLLQYLMNLFASNMRSFSSAPNGDLIAWFPDYYGLWGTAAVLRVEPIELLDFNVNWSDDGFVTHQFTLAGLTNQLDISSGSVNTVFDGPDGARVVNTLGIANIDLPEVMYSLFGVEPSDATKFAQWVYRKFGARPDFQQMEGLIGPKSEFFAALYLFMRQWAYQYNADIPTTFMPEAWPGMLMQVPAFDFQAYITTVTHSFTFGEGGSFTTQINIAAPAYMPRSGKANRDHALFGLPLAGGYAPARGLGNPPLAGDSGAPGSAGGYHPGVQDAGV